MKFLLKIIHNFYMKLQIRKNKKKIIVQIHRINQKKVYKVQKIKFN